MRTLLKTIISTLFLAGCWTANAADVYTNFIRQVQYPTGVQWDASVAPAGQQYSALGIDPGGAQFQLWTVKQSPLTSYLLESAYVGTYIPLATVTVTSEDTTTTIVRTRADRPFVVSITVEGLREGDEEPEASKSVKSLRHVQSYGVNGTGIGINRSQAILLEQTSIKENGPQAPRNCALTLIPGANRLKISGEERFSIFSLEDYQVPESLIDSATIQVWPVADGAISGIENGQLIKFTLPAVTLAYNDLYPFSTTYAQVYKGNPVLGMTGTIVPGSALVINDSVPSSRVLSLINYDSVFTSDGRWTMELVTVTPFGIERMRTPSGAPAVVTFDLDRTININTSVTTIE